MAKKKDEPEVLGFVGIGLDNTDEHQRITKSELFLVIGGSLWIMANLNSHMLPMDQIMQMQR